MCKVKAIIFKLVEDYWRYLINERIEKSNCGFSFWKPDKNKNLLGFLQYLSFSCLNDKQISIQFFWLFSKLIISNFFKIIDRKPKVELGTRV